MIPQKNGNKFLKSRHNFLAKVLRSGNTRFSSKLRKWRLVFEEVKAKRICEEQVLDEGVKQNRPLEICKVLTISIYKVIGHSHIGLSKVGLKSVS